MRICPFCAEEVQDAAIVCKHCGRDIAVTATTPPPIPTSTAAASNRSTDAENAATGRRALALAVVVIGFLVAVSSGAGAGLGILMMWIGVGFAMSGGAIIRWGGGFIAAIVLGGIAVSMRGSSTSTTATTAAATNARVVTPSTPAVAPATLPTPTKTGGKWSEYGTTSAMDDTRGVSLQLDGENVVSGWLRQRTPTLVIRCQERKTSVYVVTGMPASVESGDLEGHTVRVRLDDHPAQRQRWTESTDQEALFAPNGVQFARSLASARTLRVEFTPFNASPTLATFDVTGLSDHIGKVATACKWSQPAPSPKD